MNHISDLIKKHIVIVDNGSGVLVQPMTEEYSYILTAKHNILVDYKNCESENKALGDIKIKTLSAATLQVREIHCHQTLDIAVICIDFYPEEIKVYPYQESLRMNDEVWLYGYPSTRRVAEDFGISNYKLNIQDYYESEKKISLRNEDMAPIEDVCGYSGGGLFKINEAQDQAFLIGIENAMENITEQHERLQGIPISAFSDLLEVNKLAPLKPLHLADFKHLHKNIFQLRDCVNPANFFEVQSFLYQIANKNFQTTNIKPYDILNKLKERLVVHQRNNSELEEKELWIAILELLVITKLVDSIEQWNEIYIRSLFKSYRFIYINSQKGWKSHLQDIVSTNTEGLDPDGKVLLIIGGNLPNDPVIPLSFIKKCIPDISKGLDAEAIDNVRHTISDDITIIHWLKLHEKCIADKELDYKDLNLIEHENDIRNMLKNDYTVYLKF